jgi:hypothetical protein
MKWLARLDALIQKSERPRDGTDKTDTSPSVSSVSALPGPLQDSETPSVSSVRSESGTSQNPDYDPFANLPPNDPAYRGAWQRWFSLLTSHKLELGNRPAQRPDGSTQQSQRKHEEAHALAYGETLNLWHSTYGQRPDPHSCAGCNKPIGRSNLMALSDGARVHDDADLRCLISYGDRWRTTAANALKRLGIDERDTDELPQQPSSR